MNTLDSLLGQYAASHQHPTNVRIHKVAVPCILFSLLGMLWPLSGVAAAALTLFTLGLSRRLAGLLTLELAAFHGVFWLLYAHLAAPHVRGALAGLFALAWVMQFVGHRIEGKRPAFLSDLLFLLIGPLWILSKK